MFPSFASPGKEIERPCNICRGTGQLEDKDGENASLRRELEEAGERIAHLEDMLLEIPFSDEETREGMKQQKSDLMVLLLLLRRQGHRGL